MRKLYCKTARKASVFNGFQAIFPVQTAVNPVTGRWAFGCSICSPSMSHRYCCGVSVFTSDSERGHWYAPCSRRLYSRMKPSFSQYSPLMRSRRRPQNRNNVLVKGSNANCCWTSRARPSMPLRRSVAAGDVDLVRSGEIVQHRRRSSTSFSSVLCHSWDICPDWHCRCAA